MRRYAARIYTWRLIDWCTDKLTAFELAHPRKARS